MEGPATPSGVGDGEVVSDGWEDGRHANNCVTILRSQAMGQLCVYALFVLGLEHLGLHRSLTS